MFCGILIPLKQIIFLIVINASNTKENLYFSNNYLNIWKI